MKYPKIKQPRHFGLSALSRLGFAALTVSALVTCNSSGSDDGQSSGQRFYRQTCTVCHGANGEGKPSLGADLRMNEFVQSKTDDELVQFLIEGRAANHPLNVRGVTMPPRGGNPQLNEEDLAQIVAYLRTLE